MNRQLLLALALLGAAASPAVHAVEAYRFHASVLAGAIEIDDIAVDGGPILDELAVDRAVVYGIAAGLALGGPFLLHAEYLRSSADPDELPGLGLEDLRGSIDLQTLMVTVTVETALADGAVRPYAGLGAGWAGVDIERVGNDFLGLDGDDDVFAWQGVVGVAFPIDERLTLSVDARYLQTDDIAFAIGPGADIAADSDVETTQVIASLRYRF
jgi:opacity protein-like surface antigen